MSRSDDEECEHCWLLRAGSPVSVTDMEEELVRIRKGDFMVVCSGQLSMLCFAVLCYAVSVRYAKCIYVC